MMTAFKPMLAAKADLTRLRYPVLASPKLDGIRATVVEGRLLTRTLKDVPNKWIRLHFNHADFEGMDGELIVGSPTDPACYRNTVSGVMSHEGEPDFRFYVFDNWRRTDVWMRSALIPAYHHRALLHTHDLIESEQELEEYEAEQVALGYEGVILRDPHGPYKFGRSTVSEGYLLKVKRFTDFEAIVTGMEEEERNDNELGVDERGYAHRTSHAAGKSGKGRMGALLVTHCASGVDFKIGTGFSAIERDWFWVNRERIVAEKTRVKGRFFQYGVKDKPRHSSYLGLRPDGA